MIDISDSTIREYEVESYKELTKLFTCADDINDKTHFGRISL